MRELGRLRAAEAIKPIPLPQSGLGCERPVIGKCREHGLRRSVSVRTLANEVGHEGNPGSPNRPRLAAPPQTQPSSVHLLGGAIQEPHVPRPLGGLGLSSNGGQIGVDNALAKAEHLKQGLHQSTIQPQHGRRNCSSPTNPCMGPSAAAACIVTCRSRPCGSRRSPDTIAGICPCQREIRCNRP